MRLTSLHATALLVGSTGVLLRGRSGAGKSMLADEVIARARARGEFAALVADDQVVLTAAGGRLIARPPEVLQGRLERRGLGVMRVDHEPSAVVRGVIDLEDMVPDRVPPPNQRVVLAGVGLPLAILRMHDPANARLIAVLSGAFSAR